jgi:hypothetical protein
MAPVWTNMAEMIVKSDQILGIVSDLLQEPNLVEGLVDKATRTLDNFERNVAIKPG